MVKFIKNLILFIVVASVLVAILRIFGWDPFGVIDWAISFLWGLIDSIARWLEGTRLADWLSP